MKDPTEEELQEMFDYYEENGYIEDDSNKVQQITREYAVYYGYGPDDYILVDLTLEQFLMFYHSPTFEYCFTYEDGSTQRAIYNTGYITKIVEQKIPTSK